MACPAIYFGATPRMLGLDALPVSLTLFLAIYHRRFVAFHRT